MKKSTKLLTHAIGAIALSASVGAQAQSLSSPVLTGSATVFGPSTPGVVAPEAATTANITNVMNTGDGAIEFGSSSTSLSGTLGGNSITVSSLSLSDWTANGDALAQQYITGAASSIGATLTSVQMTSALNAFFTQNLGGGVNPYMLVSNPNISFVNLNGGVVSVGMDGFLNATSVLQSFFPSLTVPANAQVSDVAKVTYEGKTEYLYGFSATPTGYTAGNGSFTGLYQESFVPEPGTALLLVAGMAGLSKMRRRGIQA